MNQSPTISKLAAALVAAQAEIKAVTKDRKNDFFKSKYATLDAIVESVKPILAKHELAIVQGSSYPVTDERGMLRSMTLETMLIHSSGEWLLNGVVMPVGTTFDKQGHEVGPTPQTGGSSITYGRRYGLGALLSIVTDDDDDGNAASTAPKRQAPAKPQEAPAATDEQKQRIIELADATGDMAKVKDRLSSLTVESADRWIAGLTEKYNKLPK